MLQEPVLRLCASSIDAAGASAALCWSNASIYLRLCASSIDAAGGDYRGFNEASCSKAPSVSFEITAPPVSFEITY